MKHIRIFDLIVLVLVVLLVGSMLVPAVARLERTPAEAKCQSNLRQWTHAMALYVSDNNGRYPTNRNTYCYVCVSIQLTPDGLLNPDGTQKRFVYGVSWVEALYPYLQASAANTGQDWKSFRNCPSLHAYARASVSYTFNYNLVEYQDSLIRGRASLMMLREMDRHMQATLRPANLSAGQEYSAPDTAFLTTNDNWVSPAAANPNRHGPGSYVAFADGHVRYFTTDYYPTRCAWDSDTRKWYNFVYPDPADDTQRRLNKSIAVTP